jgi:hypothetical protein
MKNYYRIIEEKSLYARRLSMKLKELTCYPNFYFVTKILTRYYLLTENEARNLELFSCNKAFAWKDWVKPQNT